MKRICFLLLMVILQDAFAQSCARLDTVLKIDFGTAGKINGDFVLWTGKYRKVNHNCPDDGEYAISSSLSRCFGDSWLMNGADHTAGPYGNMLLVNAPDQPARFIHFPIFNLVGGENYIFEFQVANLLKGTVGCIPTQPELRCIIETRGGREIASFKTGRVEMQNYFTWKKYQGTFSLPAAEKELFIRIENNIPGGCGNDFAMDDLILLHCIPVKPEKKASLAVVVPPPKAPARRVILEMDPPAPKPVEIKKEPVAIVTEIPRDTLVIPKKPLIVIIPEAVTHPLEERENIVIDKYKTDAPELLIEIFDNNLVDGDSVSIYHNEQLLMSHVPITKEPYSFRIKMGPFQPHHEIVLVAENLGSTPPNTAVMIITANGKKKKIDVKSNKQKNAKVIVDWEK